MTGMPLAAYSPDAVVNRNGGCPAMLSTDVPMVIVDGAATLIALQDPLEIAACDNVSVTGAWSLLAAGANQTVGPGRTAVRRGGGSGYTPFGLNWT